MKTFGICLMRWDLRLSEPNSAKSAKLAML